VVGHLLRRAWKGQLFAEEATGDRKVFPSNNDTGSAARRLHELKAKKIKEQILIKGVNGNVT